MKHVSTLSMSRHDEKIVTLSERAGLSLRMSDDWDIRLSSRSEDSLKGKPITVAIYERNTARSGDEHFAEVYRVLASESADVVRMVDSVGGKSATIYLTKGYIEKAYQLLTLGMRDTAPVDMETCGA
jgi:hypothetical protein